MIGKVTKRGPAFAFLELGKKKIWQLFGACTVWTGFLVSSFYGVVASWVFGYCFEALFGTLSTVTTIEQSKLYYDKVMASPQWGLGFFSLFTFLCFVCVRGGVKKGIERCNTLFMPFFFVLLLTLCLWTLTLPTASNVFSFLTSCNYGTISTYGVIVALGHAFFTLSVGQGTLVTYGSYVKPQSPILSTSLYILIADVVVSLAAAFCVLSILFYAGADLECGPGLLFQTLPTILSGMAFGKLLLIAFFSLVFIAAITSQISALEPLILHLMEKYRFNRSQAVSFVMIGSYVLGIPSVFSMNILQGATLWNLNFLGCMDFMTTAVLIPLGGFFSVLLLGWRYKISSLRSSFEPREQAFFGRWPTAWNYFYLTVTYIAPVLIFIVFIQAILS